MLAFRSKRKLEDKLMTEKKTVNEGKLRIFVSHKVEDRAAAITLRDIFEVAGPNRFDFFLCEDIPPGKDWREWIEESLGKSNYLFFLCTKPEAEWDWSLYETGLFEGLGKGGLFVFYSPNSEPPEPIKHLMAIEASDKNIRNFLEIFFGGTDLTNLKKPINAAYASDKNGSLSQDASSIARLFSGKPKKRHYTDRLKVHISDSEALARGTMPTDSIVDADPKILKYFGLLEKNEEETWTWGELLEHVEGNKQWITILEECFCKANKAEAFDPIQETFQPQKSSRIFKPVLHSLEADCDGNKTFCVVFIEQFSEGAVVNAKEEYSTLLSCLTLGSRFQWEVYDKYINIRNIGYSHSELKIVCENIQNSIDNIEKDSRFRTQLEYHGNNTRDRLVWVFESAEEQKEIEVNLSEQNKLKNELIKAIDVHNAREISNILEQLNTLNLKLMAKASGRYNELLRKIMEESEESGSDATKGVEG